MSAPGVLITAPGSHGGKTLVTSALVRALKIQGLRVGSFKVGPDRFDPILLEKRTELPSSNLDSWAMRIETLGGLGDLIAEDVDFVIGEGMAGLFDGALIEQGSSADLASLFDLPVVLVVDASGLGASAAALIAGFIQHREDVDIAGVIFVHVIDKDHADRLKRACDDHFSQPVIGCLRSDPALSRPVEIGDHVLPERDLEEAEVNWLGLDLDQLQRLARPFGLGLYGPPPCPLRPLGQRIAVADDSCFTLAFPTIVEGWRQAGADILPFSPLADEAPDDRADAVYLPHCLEGFAGSLATKTVFLDGLGRAASKSAFVYGEGGGFAVLGERWIDDGGQSFGMTGLLPIKTVMVQKSHRPPLGYRGLTLQQPCPLGPAGTTFRGHAAVKASIDGITNGRVLFETKDSRGQDQGGQGFVRSSVAGSPIQLIDRVSEPGDGDFRAGPIRLVRD